jgi:hypothetical protein
MINDGNRTDYFLFFATRHPLGLSRMKDAMWKVDRTGGIAFSDVTDPDQAVLFEPTTDFEALRRLVEDRLTPGRLRVEELESFIVEETPFLATHYKKQVLVPMEKEGKLFCENRKRSFTYPEGTVLLYVY